MEVGHGGGATAGCCCGCCAACVGKGATELGCGCSLGVTAGLARNEPERLPATLIFSAKLPLATLLPPIFAPLPSRAGSVPMLLVAWLPSALWRLTLWATATDPAANAAAATFEATPRTGEGGAPCPGCCWSIWNNYEARPRLLAAGMGHHLCVVRVSTDFRGVLCFGRVGCL